jgi:GntR family transcriptional repressor for pyruvate dehydrogenase complex
VLKRLDRSSAVKPVLEQFRDAIEDGLWLPDSQIPTEGELVEMLGVGRGVVREALATLKAFGLIDSRPGRGTFVTHKPSELATWIVAIGSDNRELLEARYGIDAWINSLAAQKATPEDTARVCEMVAEMDRAIFEGKSLDEIVRLDTAFHEATHNSVLARLNVIMAASLEHSRRANIATADLLKEAVRSHHELVEAVCTHDPAFAWAATRRSLRRVARMQNIEINVDDEFAREEDRPSSRKSPAHEHDNQFA